jgi:hypothetical protein
MGRATFLPVSGTPVANELQRRVRALTGADLVLPTEPVTRAQLAQNHGLDRPAYSTGAWRTGDLEIDARAEILRSFPGGFPDSTATGIDFRLTVFGSYRLPIDIEYVGLDSWTHFDVGYRGGSAGGAIDLFLGSVAWVSAGGRATRLTRTGSAEDPANLDAFSPGYGAGLVFGGSGEEVEMWALPRLRLTDEISVGIPVTMRSWTSTEEGVADEGSLSTAGLTVRFSNMRSSVFRPRRGGIDASVGYSTGITGSDGAARASRVFLNFSILQRFWGS